MKVSAKNTEGSEPKGFNNGGQIPAYGNEKGATEAALRNKLREANIENQSLRERLKNQEYVITRLKNVTLSILHKEIAELREQLKQREDTINKLHEAMVSAEKRGNDKTQYEIKELKEALKDLCEECLGLDSVEYPVITDKARKLIAE
jgi:predicted nuclease with TOPRIM domain